MTTGWRISGCVKPLLPSEGGAGADCNHLLDEAANAEKAGLVEVKRVQHPNYDFNTLNELAQLKH